MATDEEFTAARDEIARLREEISDLEAELDDAELAMSVMHDDGDCDHTDCVTRQATAVNDWLQCQITLGFISPEGRKIVEQLLADL